MTDVDPHVETLAAAAANRRTDRRPFLADPVPQEVLAPLREVARLEGCMLRFALEDRERREVELANAGAEQRELPEYRQELAAWAGRHASAEGGAGAQAAFRPNTCAACPNGTSGWSPRGSCRYRSWTTARCWRC
ncbi:hypothetical protein ACWDKQ_28170 [Saccharopolyspora sp. NPDC000995]